MVSKECKKEENGKTSSEIIDSDLGKNVKNKTCEDYPKKLSRKSTSIKVVSSVPIKRDECLNWYGWGYSDSGFTMKDGIIRFAGNRYAISGKELPHVFDYIKDKYNVELTENYESSTLKMPEEKSFPKSKFSDETIREIENLGIEVSVNGVKRLTRSGGQTYDEIIKLRKHEVARIPDAIAWPTCHEEVEKLVELADLDNFVIIPFGGGTSVARGIECPANETRPILSLDTNKMNEILWVDSNNMTMCAESGIIGQDLERELNKIGFTTGHEPDSIEFSTLGGWVSTRASGMKKNLYGNIEDLMIHARLVTPKGVMEKHSKAPRVSCGPDFNHMILGSEGNLGVITEVVLKIRPLAECQAFESVVFPDFQTGVAFMREIALRRWQPASIRLMDEEQFQIGWSLRPKCSYFTTFFEWMKFKYLENIKRFSFNKICLCTIAHEGTKLEVPEHIKKIMNLAVEMGGVQSGETVGKRGYMMTYVVAYMRDIAIEFNVVAESMETSMPWDTVYEASRQIRETVTSEGINMGVNKSLCMMRIAQTYDSGCCLYVYFSFSISPDRDGIAMCNQMNDKIKAVCLKYGGSLSHHHGIGKLKRKWYPSFVSEPAVSALKCIKQQLDPKNIFATRNILENFYCSDEDSVLKAKL